MGRFPAGCRVFGLRRGRWGAGPAASRFVRRIGTLGGRRAASTTHSQTEAAQRPTRHGLSTAPRSNDTGRSAPDSRNVRSTTPEPWRLRAPEYRPRLQREHATPKRECVVNIPGLILPHLCLRSGMRDAVFRRDREPSEPGPTTLEQTGLELAEVAPTELAATEFDPARFSRIRAETDALCAPLSAEDCAAQSMPDASPAKWHMAHTSWFFETFVLGRLDSYRPFCAGYDYLFNSYYDAVGARHPRAARGLLTRPSFAEVLAYRSHVTERMLELGARHGRDLGELAAIIELGLQHEQQHQELLLTDIKHLFGSNPLRPAYTAAAPRAPAEPLDDIPLEFLRFAGGVVQIGHVGPHFAFDNESPRHRVFLEPYAMSNRLVTNGEFTEFIADGGYERPELWLADGFRVNRACGWRAPLYWEAGAAAHASSPSSIYTLAGVAPLVANEPVCHVSYYEADAYARWRGARLPTEAEWELLAGGTVVRGNFRESGRLHPAPAVAAQAHSPQQLFGDTWEWTQSSYSSYPGYQPTAGALGEYNGKFMCNQMVLRGGSCVTPRDHVRATYRNFFPPEARWQFAGFRLARSE
jgi:ergothioneine biosynthesis protein EgtB